MEIIASQLPSGGYGYDFASLTIKPMNFLELTQYLENVPKDDPLGKYLFDIKVLAKDDPNILKCYVMDVDFLIFYKKLCTVSSELTYNLSITCPHCGSIIKKTISLEKDIHFNQIDPKIMNGAVVELAGHKYSVIVPTAESLMRVLSTYDRYKKINDINMIKTIALIEDFDTHGNQVERDVLGATHEDITLLMALRDVYYNTLEPLSLQCPNCTGGEEGGLTVSLNSLIVDFFRDLYNNSPINGSKILFK